MPKQLQRKVTLSRIAELSGVSRPLVSAILGNSKGGSTRYSQETYDSVMRIAEMAGYRPNRTARSLRSNRHGNLGILTRRLGSANSTVLNMMQETASAEFGQCLVLGRTIGPNDPPGEPAVFLREDFVDGIVVVDFAPEALQAQIADLGTPTVWLNTGVTGRGALNHDEAGAVAQTARLLWDRGCRQLAILAIEDPHYSHAARIAALRQVCQAAGAPPPVVHSLTHNIFDRDQFFAIVSDYQDWLRANPTVDGLLLSLDMIAGPLYRAAASLGRRIPDDLRIVGFNDSYVATSITPSLTSLRIDGFEAGRQAIRLLNAYIDGAETPADPSCLTYSLVEREST